MRRNHPCMGFSLVEVMVALMIVGSLLTLWASFEGSRAQTRARNIVVSKTSEELAILGRAALQWRDHASGGKVMLPSTRQEVALEELVNLFLLPSAFAQRSTDASLGWSPLGGRFVVVAYKGASTSSPVKLVIYTSGLDPNYLVKTPIGTGAAVERTVMGEVAVIATNKYRAVAGTIDSDTSQIRGSFKGFSYNLANWFPQPLSRPAAALLVGFDDLDPNVEWYTDPSEKYGDCTIQPATAAGSGQCPLGSEAVGAWGACTGLFPSDTDAIDTAMGKITFTQEESKHQDARTDCGGACNTLAAPGAAPNGCGEPPASGVSCGSFSPTRIAAVGSGARYDPGAGIPLNHQEIVTVYLNRAPVHRAVCRTGTWTGSGSSTTSVSTARLAGFQDRLCCAIK